MERENLSLQRTLYEREEVNKDALSSLSDMIMKMRKEMDELQLVKKGMKKKNMVD
jgi:hypothetical protein